MNYESTPTSNHFEAYDQTPLTEEDKYYRALFAFPQPQGADRFGNNLDLRLQTTKEGRESAATVYQAADDDIKQIFHNPEYHLDTQQPQYADETRESALLRNNLRLRVALGTHVLNKLLLMSDLPPRFYLPQTKMANYPGYPAMSSHKYAALLSLSMLDGTFDPPSSDPIESVDGQVVLGQHRWAAHRALGTTSLVKVNEQSR